MLADLSIESIEINPFNPRLNQTGLDNLTRSLARNGQLSPIKVRPSKADIGKYELIFGHRRFQAARNLGWKSIRAEIVSSSDQQMAIESLIENMERKDLCAYEKAQTFERIYIEFNLSYAEIGKIIGLSRQHVSNYLAMLRLFDPERLSRYPELRDALFKITEHHSRILSRVEDENSRMDLTLKVVKDNLTVKDLANIVARLRSWFVKESDSGITKNEGLGIKEPYETEARNFSSDRETISRLIHQKFDFPHNGNYEKYKKVHLFREGFTMYSAFPPFDRLTGKQAVSREYEWFHNIAPKLYFQIQDLRIDLLDAASLATFSVMCYSKSNPSLLVMKMVATVVLRKRDGYWFVLHEHWTKLDAVKTDTAKNEQMLAKLR